VPILNLTLNTWRRDLEDCVKRFGVHAVKLTPNNHQLELADRRADELCDFAAEKKLNVCVQMRMMDERTHHPLMKVPAVPAAELAALAARHPCTQFVACGIYNGELVKIRDASNVTVEISMVESGQSLINALPNTGPERLVFGSHSPLLYFESALAKLNVDPQFVPGAQIAAIASGNARRLLSS
jgi:uncharacterized protein